jgi:hypothetical protein
MNEHQTYHSPHGSMLYGLDFLVGNLQFLILTPH